MAPNASSQTIRLRVLTSLTSKGTTQNMYLCRIDPSLPCRSVISTIACLVYSKSNDHSSMDSFSNAEQGASWEHPEFGGRRFLEGYSVFYRGRPVVSQLFDSHHHQHDSSSSATTELPFGVVCPMEEGEELLIRKRTAAATAMMQVSSHQTQGAPDVLPTTTTMSITSRYQTPRRMEFSSLSTPAHQQQKQQQPRESPFLSSPQMLASGRRRVGFDSFNNNSNTFGDGGGTSLPLLLHSISTDDVPFQSTSKTTTVGALVAPRTQRQLQSALVTFLTRCGIVEWFSPFAVKAGILSLGELCTHSAESLAAVIDHATPPEDFLKAIRFPPKRKDVMIGSRRPLFPHNNHQDQHHRHARESTKQASSPLSQQNTTTMPSPSSTSAAAATPTFMAADWNYEVSSFPLAVFAHRLISTAHWSMKASGLVIDWPKRLRSYLLRVDPERALGSDIVESARIRAVMDHDGGGASASTADVFGDHQGKKKGADRHHRGDATVDDDDDAGSGMDRGFERVWWELRRQYEEHLVQAIQDAEEKGVILPPYMADDDDDDDGMGQERQDRGNIGNVSSHVNGLVLRAAESANEAHAAASVSTSFLVCCPDCSHAFQYAPPSLPWQLAEFQRAVANAELTSISLQKEHALREEQFSDTIQSLGTELQRLRQESKEWKEKALLEANRAAALEGENRSFRQRLRMSDDLFGRGVVFATTERAVPPTTTNGKIVGVRTSGVSRRKHGEDHSSLLHQRAVVTSSHLEESIVRSDGDTSTTTTVPADAAVNPEEKKRIRRVLAQYLQEHNPDSLMMIDSILAQWKHREYELERVLRIPPSKAPKGLQDAAVRGWVE